MSINNNNKMMYFIKQCETQLITTRKLRERIKSDEYERLPELTKNINVKTYLKICLFLFIKKGIIVVDKNFV